MLKNLPKLEIVKIDNFIYHEKYDPYRVERLAKRMCREGIQKNPIIVTQITNKFLILDGVTRATALKKLGYKYALVQVINYFNRDIKLNSWNHLILNTPLDPFISKIKKIKGLEIKKIKEKHAENLLKNKKIIGYFIFKNKTIMALFHNKKLGHEINYLNKVVNLYNRSEIYRTDNKEIKNLINKYEDLVAVFVTPKYSKNEVLAFASKNILIPCGVTKHTIPNRVLRFNMNLALLKGDITLKKINEYLIAETKNRLEDKRIRAYSETVFIFDE